MDEMTKLLTDILYELKTINSKLDDIRGIGVHSIDDIYYMTDTISDKLTDIQGSGLYDNLADIGSKLDNIETYLM